MISLSCKVLQLLCCSKKLEKCINLYAMSMIKILMDGSFHLSKSFTEFNMGFIMFFLGKVLIPKRIVLL